MSDIRVGARIRQAVPDVTSLATSMQQRGLLRPILVCNKDLIAGQRRIEAAKQIGWTHIDAYSVTTLEEALERLAAELEENTERVPLAPGEIVEAAKKLEERMAAEAEERKAEGQKAGGRTAGRGRKKKKKLGAKKAPSKGKTRSRVGRAYGISGETYRKAKEVVKLAKEHPELKYIVKEMNETHNVNAAYKKMMRALKEKADAAAVAAGAEAIRNDLGSVCDIRHCSMQELLRDTKGIDAIISDLPYPEKFLPLYGELAKLAVNVPLVAIMCGHTFLPQIMAAMCGVLKYRWTLAYLTPGGQAASEWHVKVNVFWKPILLFGNAQKWIGDVVKSDVNDNDKEHHDWGQSESGMAALIDRLTEPGQLVCDPFLGGGTTAVVAVRMGRRFVGCDIDEKCVKTTWARLLSLGKKNERAAD